MRTRLVPYVPFGAKKDPLPDALEAKIVTPLGELPTAQVHYHRQGVNAVSLDGITELAAEYWTGTAWVEPPNCRFLSMKGAFDHLEQTPTRKYDFLGIGWMLRQAKVWEPAGLPVDADGKVQFLSATAGQIMGTLIQNAKTRGWGTGLDVDFTPTIDSAGHAWDKVVTIAYDLELDLEAVLSNLYQQGVCDYRWTGRTLQIFNPDAAMGRDLAVGAEPVRLIVADGQTAAPEDWSNEDLLTDALVLGDDGKKWTFANGASTPLGRLERVIAQGGVSDEGTASLLADQELIKGSRTRISYTREFAITEESRVWPFRDYLPGDWVMAQRGTGFEKLRTHSLSLTINADGVKGHAVLGDRLEDLLTKLAKRTKGITGGASAGGSGARPAPEGPDTRSPSAPTGLVVAADAYIDKDGLVQGVVQIDWAHDGKATDGTTIDVDRYQVYYRENVLGAVWKQLLSTQDTEAAYSPLPVATSNADPAQYSFKVRAVAESGRASAFSDQYVVVMEKDTTPPPAPEFRAEDVTTSLRTVTVSVTGKGAAGETMPLDFSHFNVYEATSPSAAGVKVSEKQGAGPGLAYQSRSMPADVTIWYYVTAVDHSGNESAPSVRQSVTPTANVDMAAFFDHMDAAQVEITNAGALILEAGNTLAQKLAGTDQALSAADGRLDKAETAINVSIPTQLQLLIDRGANLVRNGGFEQDLVGWGEPIGPVTVSTTIKRGGAKSLRMGPRPDSNAYIFSSDRVPSNPGRIYQIEAWFRREAGTTGTGAAGFVVARTLADGTVPVNIVYGSTKLAALPTDSWVKVTERYTVPTGTPGTTDIRFGPWTQTPGVGVFVDDMRVVDVTEAVAADAKAQLALNSANGKNARFRSLVDPNVDGTAVGDTWWKYADDTYRVVIGQWTWSGSGWVPDGLGHQVISSVDLGALTVVGQSTLADVVAQSVASATAAFQRADIRNLFVTDGAVMDAAVIQAIDSQVVRASRIYADQLLLGRGANMIVDPRFGDPKMNAARAAGGQAVFQSNVDLPGSVHSLYFSDVGAAYKPQHLGVAQSQYAEMTPVTPGARLHLSVYVRTLAGIKWNWGYYAKLTDGTTAWRNTGISFTHKTTGGGTYEADWTVPADVTAVTFALQMNPSPVTYSWCRFEQPFVGQQIGSSLIAQGSILAPHLTVTEEMWAKIINFKLIQGDQIDTNSLTSDTGFIGDLETNFLTSDRFVGKLFEGGEFVGGIYRTRKHAWNDGFGTTSYTRLDDDGLSLEIASPAQGGAVTRFKLDAHTGNVYMYDAEIHAGVVEGAVVRSSSELGHVEMTPAGLYGYDDWGERMFTVASGNGFVFADKRFGVGEVGLKRIILNSANDGGRQGIWFSETGDGSIGGSATGGLWIDDGWSELNIRGKDAAGVVAWGGLTVNSGLVSNARVRLLDTPSTTQVANAHISVGGSTPGTVYLSSSASRYKLDQQVMDLPDELLDIPVKDWIDLAQYEDREYLATLGVRDEQQQLVFDDLVHLRRVPGMVAEDVAAVPGGEPFVIYGADGQVEGLAYERLANARTAVLKRQLDELAAKVAPLLEQSA